MRGFPLFFLKNSVSAKMKKGLRRSFCNGAGSTSTLNQRRPDQEFSCLVDASLLGSSSIDEAARPSTTLEEMIWQLELEEEAARRAEVGDYRRMSCVNNSDILRSARNALNQYPRFSLDGRDSMYRSSFRNLCYEEGRRKSLCCSNNPHLRRDPEMPTMVAGERVVWCKPGVVAKLMGLDAVPVPVRTKLGRTLKDQRAVAMRSEMKRFEEKNKRRIDVGMHGFRDAPERMNVVEGGGTRRRRSNGDSGKERSRMEWGKKFECG
ncbi:hypothetical protein H6P81_003054 [Aristolochia fimbriata]|uniref:DUF3741 domain-containing protein n=1 Tax=Aristolochia fimbriata TaxID=158543 RepID=A0AAV7FEP6_ARIFI|nr:hypothetical protein H6P81_003054 [Aristolochia fimbriata]